MSENPPIGFAARRHILLSMITFDIDPQRRLATATLARPPVNGMNAAWLDRFDQVIAEVEATPGLAALRIRSACKVFSAGGDLAFMRDNLGTQEGRAALVQHVARCQRAFARLAGLPLVTVAQVGGHALGGGFELALACDFRLLAEDVQVALPEATVGLIPGAGGTQRVAELAGQAIARRVVLTGRRIDSATALAWNLCDAVHPVDALDAATLAFCRELSPLSSTAIAQAKRCLAVAGGGTEEGYAREIEAIAAQFADADTRARIAAFFADKPAPR